MVTMPKVLQDLETRKRMWEHRFKTCREIAGLAPKGQELRYLALHAARTKTVNAARNAYQKKDFIRLARILSNFERNNQVFFDKILEESRQFLEGAHTAVDLYCGPGLFTRRLQQIIPTVFGVELVDELAHKAYEFGGIKEVFHGSPNDVLKNIEDWEVDAFTSIRGFLHSPEDERVEVLRQIGNVLRKDGVLVCSEMFKDNVPAGRRINPGTWYWYVAEYKTVLTDFGFDLCHVSGTIDNEGDPCRVLVFIKH